MRHGRAVRARTSRDQRGQIAAVVACRPVAIVLARACADRRARRAARRARSRTRACETPGQPVAEVVEVVVDRLERGDDSHVARRIGRRQETSPECSRLARETLCRRSTPALARASAGAGIAFGALANRFERARSARHDRDQKARHRGEPARSQANQAPKRSGERRTVVTTLRTSCSSALDRADIPARRKDPGGIEVRFDRAHRRDRRRARRPRRRSRRAAPPPPASTVARSNARRTSASNAPSSRGERRDRAGREAQDRIAGSQIGDALGVRGPCARASACAGARRAPRPSTASRSCDT